MMKQEPTRMFRISEFIKPPEIEITVVTYRSIFQAEHAHEKFGDAYVSHSAEVVMDARDMERIGVKDGENVKLQGEHGSVVVRARRDDEKHEGIAFMCNSIFANLLATPTQQHAMPSLKRIRVRVSATKEEVTDMRDIIRMKSSVTSS